MENYAAVQRTQNQQYYSIFINIFLFFYPFINAYFTLQMMKYLVGNGNFNLYSRFNVDGGDLLDDLRRRMQIDDTLVNSHLQNNGE